MTDNGQGLVTYQGEGAGTSYNVCARGRRQMPNMDTCASLGSFVLTKDGSQKKVKDVGELAKMMDTNAA